MSDLTGLAGLGAIVVIGLLEMARRAERRRQAAQGQRIESLQEQVQVLLETNSALMAALLKHSTADGAEATAPGSSGPYPDRDRQTARRPTQDECDRATLGLQADQELSHHLLKTAYRDAVKRTHPDTGGSTDQLLSVKRAYERLKRTM